MSETDRDRAEMRREFVKLVDDERRSAVRAERSHIVEFLRANMGNALMLEEDAAIALLAGGIERGEHL